MSVARLHLLADALLQDVDAHRLVAEVHDLRSGGKSSGHGDEDALAGRSGVARRATGSFTSMPRCIIGAATMKMISSTSITSTSGTTLISASEVATRGGRGRARPMRRRRRPEPSALREVPLGRCSGTPSRSRPSPTRTASRAATGGCRSSTAGIAATRPAAVAISASAMPGADDAEVGRAGLRRCPGTPS